MTTPSQQETFDEIVRFADYQTKYNLMVAQIAQDIKEFAAEHHDADFQPDPEDLVNTYMEGLAADVLAKLSE
jgi:hypothetical protein